MVPGKPTQRRAWPRARRPAAAPGLGAGAVRPPAAPPGLLSAHGPGRFESPHASLGARPSLDLRKTSFSDIFLKAFSPRPFPGLCRLDLPVQSTCKWCKNNELWAELSVLMQEQDFAMFIKPPLQSRASADAGIPEAAPVETRAPLFSHLYS